MGDEGWGGEGCECLMGTECQFGEKVLEMTEGWPHDRVTAPNANELALEC